MDAVTEKINNAKALMKEGRLDDALVLLDKLNNMTMISSQEIWQVMNLMAWCNWKQGEKTKAKNIWEAVLSHREDGCEEEILSSVCTGLSLCWAEKRNKEKAIEYKDLALSLLPREAMIGNMRGCAIAMARAGEFKKAEELFGKVIEISKQLVGLGNPEINKETTHQIGKTCYSMAVILYIPQKNKTGALSVLNQALSAYKEISAERETAETHSRLAEVLEETGSFKEALNNESCALKIWEKEYMPNCIKMAESNIARLKEKIAK